MALKFTIVDLFCGAGGLSLGCSAAGLQPILAIDHWQPAVSTYRLNIGEHVSREEICPEIELPMSDIIAGGPPCQGFSSAGKRRIDDDRNSLISVFASIVVRYRPKVFVFENVEGFLTNGRGKFLFNLLTPLIGAGYFIHVRKINAANYGVPQHRKRVIAIGGLGWSPTFPQPTHTAFGAPGAPLGAVALQLTPTVDQALDGLGPAEDARTTRQPSDHAYSPFGPDDQSRAMLLKPGERMRDLPEKLWHESYRRRANRRVMDGTPSEQRGGAPSGLRRLRPDEPSKTITGGALNEFVHPREDRPLSIRECARLQTFPDSFRFLGAPRDCIQLIGNAVPPAFGEALARSIMGDLSSEKPKENGPGRLLSFVPTNSIGMSPILEEVTTMVKEKFSLEKVKARQASFLSWD